MAETGNGQDSSALIAERGLKDVMRGDVSRDLAELRLHLAHLELCGLSEEAQEGIRVKFGSLLAPEYEPR